MFGRKKDDDEYIAPVEEYRDDEDYSDNYDSYDGYNGGDCAGHSHEISYNAGEYRRDCNDHSHGQTYSNYNSEQSSYDDDGELRSEFEKYLEPGEVMLWAGRFEKNANFREKGPAGTFFIFPIMWFGFIGFFILMMIMLEVWFALPFMLPFVGAGFLVLYAGSIQKKSKYAITDKRVMSINKTGLTSDYYHSVYDIRYYRSPRNKGFVSYIKAVYIMNGYGRSARRSSSGICAISDPEKVFNILSRAVADYNNKNNNFPNNVG